MFKKLLNSIFSKIRVYPGQSVLISSLVISILAIESGILSSSPKTTESVATSITTPITTSITAVALNEKPDSSQSDGVVQSIDAEIIIFDAPLDIESENPVRVIDSNLATLLANKNFSVLREELLELASIAVSENDKKRLGYILNLLGQISIQESDLHSAKVYLTEALDVFTKLQDSIGSAQIHLQLGRVHLKSRQIARVAGTAYDELQIGRWYLAKGLLSDAEQFINRSIERNLSINRYGSVASAYESLARLYLKRKDFFKAKESAFESARMYASSGNMFKVRNVLKLAPQSQGWLLTELEKDIETNFDTYNNGILQIERAKDYRRLYYFYKNKGDAARAWHFRLLANQSLGQISKRTLFHRQQGVLAILYNSNEDMDKAEDYFVQAKSTFMATGMEKLASETETLNQQIY